VQQADALNNRRGIWVDPPADLLTMTAADSDSAEYALMAGDDGVDGITYVAGVPTAVIEGETVFIAYGGDLGWGYYDHWHHWRGVPGRYREHLEHFHPYGHGLRGYGHEETLHREEAMHREAAFHPGGMHPGMDPSGMHPGMAAPGVHPGMTAAGMRPGAAAPGMGHPNGFGGGFIHPGPSVAGFHPGGATLMAHAAPAVHASSGGGGGGKKH
jgi:hypothetical protein